jgi:regulator of sigma D
MLDHYSCPTPLDVIKMRFCGAICSPNLKLTPVDVISSFFEEAKTPRLETKAEADLFFKFFMGLWDEVFASIVANKVSLSSINSKDVAFYCQKRFDEIEMGFVEGFFGGQENLKMAGYLAQIVDSVSELALVYNKLKNTTQPSEKLFEAIKNTDKMVEQAISFIIEHSVLPRIEDLKRQVN